MFFEGRDDAHKLPKTARNMLGPSTDGQETLKLILRLHKEQYPIAVFKSAKLSQKNRRVPFSPDNSEHFLKLQLPLKIRVFEEFTLYFLVAAKNSLKNRIFPLGKVFAIFGTRQKTFT